jgi:hypothetical protein
MSKETPQKPQANAIMSVDYTHKSVNISIRDDLDGLTRVVPFDELLSQVLDFKEDKWCYKITPETNLGHSLIRKYENVWDMDGNDFMDVFRQGVHCKLMLLLLYSLPLCSKSKLTTYFGLARFFIGFSV